MLSPLEHLGGNGAGLEAQVVSRQVFADGHDRLRLAEFEDPILLVEEGQQLYGHFRILWNSSTPPCLPRPANEAVRDLGIGGYFGRQDSPHIILAQRILGILDAKGAIGEQGNLACKELVLRIADVAASWFR